MKDYLLVGLGGMLGCIARYLSIAYFYPNGVVANFPWGTFFVNLSGCFLIGMFTGFTERAASFNSEIRLLVTTGFLGGFTTFSSFGLETLNLLRDGVISLAIIYIISSVVGGVVLAFVGFKIVL